MTLREREVIGAVLRGLSAAGGTALGETMIHGRANFFLRAAGDPPALQSEFERALQWLDGDGRVIGTRGPMGNARWSISTAGRHLLADEAE